MARSVYAKVILDMHGIYKARTPEAIIPDSLCIPGMLWVYMTLCIITMLLIFKNKSEKQEKTTTITKWLSWKGNILILIMMLTMKTEAMIEIETGNLPVLKDTTGVVVCMAGKQPLSGKTRKLNGRKYTYIS